MKHCNHNKTPSFFVVCSERFFIFCCLQLFLSRASLLLFHLFLVFARMERFGLQQRKYHCQITACLKIKMAPASAFLWWKVWKNQVMRFCSFFNSFVSMDAIKSNSKPAQLLPYFSFRKWRPYAPNLTLHQFYWVFGKKVWRTKTQRNSVLFVFWSEVSLRLWWIMGFALDWDNLIV